MDHLPSVVSPFDPILIPYLDGEEYDGLDFSGYPSRQSWQVNLLAKGFPQGRTALEGAQFLQAWLYFGMLHEALRLVEDDRIPLQAFIRFDEGLQRKYITTSQLLELLRNWHHRVKQMPDSSAYYERFRACMQRSCEVWRDLMESSDNGNTTQLLSHEILLSIQVLGAALDIGITEICGSRADYTWRVVPKSKWLMQRMISQGWCSTVVEQLSKPCATFLYYASLLGPPRPGDDHSKCSANGKACLATNTNDGAEYKAKHVLDSCNCQHISISTGDGSPVADAIRSGNVPIIHLKDDGEELVIEIQEYSVSSPIKYTAISHV